MRSLLLALLVVAGCTSEAAQPSTEPPNDAPPDAERPAIKHAFVSVLSAPANLFARAAFRDGAQPSKTEGCVLTHGAFTPEQPVATIEGSNVGDVQVSFVHKVDGRKALPLTWNEQTAIYEAEVYGSKIERLDVPGERVDVSVNGNAFSPFEASVVAAADFELMGVARAVNSIEQEVELNPDADLDLEWTKADNSEMTFDLRGSAAYVRCRFPAPAKSGVVPREMIRTLLAAPLDEKYCSTQTTCLNGKLVGRNETHVRAGEYEVEVAHEMWRILHFFVRP